MQKNNFSFFKKQLLDDSKLSVQLHFYAKNKTYLLVSFRDNLIENKITIIDRNNLDNRQNLTDFFLNNFALSFCEDARYSNWIPSEKNSRKKFY